MRVRLKTVKAEDMFPVMDVVDGVAVSVRGAFSVGWELTLPVAYTMDEDEYDEMQESLASALRVLPPWTVVHRQDLFVYKRYKTDRTEYGSYLEKCHDAHFEGRRYLDHKAYLFVTFGDGFLVNKEGRKSGLFGLKPNITPPPRQKFDEFLSKAGEFMRIAQNTGHFKARKLTREDWLGNDAGDVGIVQRYMNLGQDGPIQSDYPMSPSSVQVHDRIAQSFVVGEAKHMPTTIPSVKKNETMSNGPCEMFLSLGAGIGILLDCEHVVNHYIVVPPQAETLQNLDSKRKSMNAGINSRDNRVNYGEIAEYLDDAERENYLTVLTHLDVIAWGTAKEQDAITGKVNAGITTMGMVNITRNMHNAPVLWYAGIPSAEVDLGTENMMTQEVHAALCLGCYETFDDGFGKGDIRLCDRLRNKPIVIDIDEVSAQMRLNNAYNKIVIGPTGTGKSFAMNRILTCEYNMGAVVFGIDVGDSYESHTRVINETSGGRDGLYLSWGAGDLPSFNPFVGFTKWLDAEGNLAVFSEEDTGVDYILAILKTLYEPKDGWTSYNEPILSQILLDFVKKAIADGKTEENLPVFDDFYRFVLEEVTPQMKRKRRRKKDEEDDGKVGTYMVGGAPTGVQDFDVEQFHRSLQAYSATGTFRFFYNAKVPGDIFSSRWVIAELYRITKVEDRNFFSLVVLQLMHSFELKMYGIKGRKVLVVDEAWQAIMNKTMAPYLKKLWKVCRKYSTAAIVVTQEIKDLTGSDVIKDAIVANSDIKILLNQTSNRNALLSGTNQDEEKDIRKILGFTKKDIALLLSMDKQNNPAYKYREIFIKYSNGYSAVFANEASPQELLAFESNIEKKGELVKLAKETGSYVKAIETLVEEKRRKS